MKKRAIKLVPKKKTIVLTSIVAATFVTAGIASAVVLLPKSDDSQQVAQTAQTNEEATVPTTEPTTTPEVNESPTVSTSPSPTPSSTPSPTEETPKHLYGKGSNSEYLYNRREAISKPIGGNWGWPNTWAYYARQNGFNVDRKPAKNDIAVSTTGTTGQAFFVESVNTDGSVVVSSHNLYGTDGDVSKTIPSSQVTSYQYIH